MKKLIKKTVRLGKKQEQTEEIKMLDNGIFATNDGFVVRFNGQEERYEGNEAFSIAAKRFKIMRGF